MAFLNFSDSLGFGAFVISGTGTLIAPTLLTSDGTPTVRTAGNAFTISGSFNQGGVKFTMAGAATAANTIRIDSLTYTDATGTPTITVGQMNLFLFSNVNLAGTALTRLLSGDDAIFGNRFSDYIEGGSGNDRILGRDGQDTLLGEGGNDFLHGEGGNDVIRGGLGADTVIGGGGADILTGGAGRDIFRFVAMSDLGMSDTADLITDFVRGTDRIDLSLIDAFTATRANDSFVFRGTGAFTGKTTGEIRYEKIDAAGSANDATIIYIDTDSDTTPEAVIRLQGLYDLQTTDFLL